MTEKKNKESLDFYGLGIDPKILNALNELKFTTPTPIQFKSIPITIEGKDIVGIAQTGTGKTLAFGIPMIQRLAKLKGKGLILIPTRELAIQVEESLRLLGGKLGLKTAVLIGGEPIGKQFQALKRNPHIVVATPGRLVDHLKRRTFNLNDLKILVFDEADMMFDMGFAPQIKEIIRLAPQARQTMLFSATMPPQIMEIAAKHMAIPVRIEVDPAGTSAENVAQEMIIVKNEDRLAQIERILKEYSGSVLIFVRTKHGVRGLCRKIQLMGYKAAEIHSNRSLFQRREALSGFKNGRFRILVATDIAARGLDVKGIELVINYDLPEDSEDYVHRIGRTGRAGKSGLAISFALPNQIKNIRQIERLVRKEIPKTKLVELAIERKQFGPRRRPMNRRFGRR